jgi:hypothetical protein
MVTDLKDLVDPLDRPIWGAEAISRVVGRSEGETSYLLQKGILDADKAGKYWTSTPRRLLRQFQEGKAQ